MLIQDVHTDTFKEIYLGEEKNLKSLKVSKTNFSSFPHWTNISFDFNVLAKRFRELAFLNAGLHFTLVDERTDKKENFQFVDGISAFVRFLNEEELTPQQVIQILGFKGNNIRPSQIVYTGKRFRPALGREKFPVATVTYDGAEAYCDWVNMRLPSEAEWVAAIRGGTKTLYPWGDTATLEDANWGREWKGYMPTTEVASFQPNAYGVYDGMGNVWEWTSTQYLPYDGRMVSSDRKERKVLRGGDWFVQPSDVSVYTRLALEPQVRGLMDGGVGFRCAMGA